jgi:hypothetical protein
MKSPFDKNASLEQLRIRQTCACVPFLWLPAFREGTESGTLGRFTATRQPPRRPRGAENQLMVAKVIRADLARADPPETSGSQHGKRLRSPPVAEVSRFLTRVDVRAQIPVVSPFDRPALLMMLITSPDRVVRRLDPESHEVLANSVPASSSDLKCDHMPPRRPYSERGGSGCSR